MFASCMDKNKQLDLNNWGVTLIDGGKLHSQIIIETVQKLEKDITEKVHIYFADFMSKTGPCGDKCSEGKSTGPGMTQFKEIPEVRYKKKGITFIRAREKVQAMIDEILLEKTDEKNHPTVYYYLGTQSALAPAAGSINPVVMKAHNCSTWAQDKLYKHLSITTCAPSKSGNIMLLPSEVAWDEKDWYDFFRSTQKISVRMGEELKAVLRENLIFVVKVHLHFKKKEMKKLQKKIADRPAADERTTKKLEHIQEDIDEDEFAISCMPEFEEDRYEDKEYFRQLYSQYLN